MDKSTIEAVHLEQETEAGGPLYTNSNSDAKSSSSSTGPSSSSSSSSSSQDGIAQEEVSAGDAPETVFRDTSSGENENTSSGADKTQKSPKENAAHAENVSTGGHSVETNGPLYGK